MLSPNTMSFFIHCAFLVGVSEERARLRQWQVFSSIQRDRLTFCALCTFTVLSTWFWTHPKSLTWNTKPLKSIKVPFPRFFGTMRLSPFSRLFPEKFLMSSKGPPSFFLNFEIEWMFKNPKGSPFTFFGIMRLFRILFSSDIRLSQYISTKILSISEFLT